MYSKCLTSIECAILFATSLGGIRAEYFLVASSRIILAYFMAMAISIPIRLAVFEKEICNSLEDQMEKNISHQRNNRRFYLTMYEMFYFEQKSFVRYVQLLNESFRGNCVLHTTGKSCMIRASIFGFSRFNFMEQGYSMLDRMVNIKNRTMNSIRKCSQVKKIEKQCYAAFTLISKYVIIIGFLKINQNRSFSCSLC